MFLPLYLVRQCAERDKYICLKLQNCGMEDKTVHAGKWLVCMQWLNWAVFVLCFKWVKLTSRRVLMSFDGQEKTKSRYFHHVRLALKMTLHPRLNILAQVRCKIVFFVNKKLGLYGASCLTSHFLSFFLSCQNVCAAKQNTKSTCW